MAYGFPEDDSSETENGNLHARLTDCFCTLLNKTAAALKIKFKCIRVGKLLLNSTTPRPVKIIFNNSESVDIILQAFIKSKNQKKLPVLLKQLVIARDQTPAQRQEYLALKEEMKRRTSAGEKNLKIVTRGTRQIIVQHARTSVLSQMNKDQ